MTYFLVFISHPEGGLLQEALQALPREASIARAVDGALGSVHEDDLVVVAAPHEIVNLTIQVECLEVDCGRHVFMESIAAAATAAAASGVAAHSALDDQRGRSEEECC